MIVQIARTKLDYSAGAIKSFEIKTQNFLKSVVLYLSGTLTVGTANGTGLVEDQPYTLLRNVTLKNGSTQIYSAKGKHIKMINFYDYGTLPEATPVSSANTGTYSFSAIMSLDMECLRASVPYATLLEASKKSNLLIEVEFGQTTDLVTPDTSTVLTLSNCSVAISTIEETERYLPYPQYPEKKISFYEKARTSSGSLVFSDLPVGNFIRRIMLINRNNGVRANLADTDTVEVMSDSATLIIKSDWASLYKQDKADYGLSSLQTGVANLDFDVYQNFSNLLDMRGNNRKLEVKITQAGSPTSPADVTLIVEEIIPSDKVIH